jgi:hypothetical protein
MGLPMYSEVRLTADKYRSKGIAAGDIGTIIEILKDGEAYGVEFSDSEGITITFLSLSEDDFEPFSPSAKESES